jgi:hypothetical protein
MGMGIVHYIPGIGMAENGLIRDGPMAIDGAPGAAESKQRKRGSVLGPCFFSTDLGTSFVFILLFCYWIYGLFAASSKGGSPCRKLFTKQPRTNKTPRG